MACYAHCHWDVTGLGILRDRVGTLLQKRADGRLVKQFWDRANPQSKGSSRLERTAELGSEGRRGAGYRARVGFPAHGRGLAGAQRRVVTLESLKTHHSGKTHPWGKFQEKQGIPILSKHLQSSF